MAQGSRNGGADLLGEGRGFPFRLQGPKGDPHNKRE